MNLEKLERDLWEAADNLRADSKLIFQQIDTLKRQIKHIESARDLLLPRLISGRLRL